MGWLKEPQLPRGIGKLETHRGHRRGISYWEEKGRRHAKIRKFKYHRVMMKGRCHIPIRIQVDTCKRTSPVHKRAIWRCKVIRSRNLCHEASMKAFSKYRPTRTAACSISWFFSTAAVALVQTIDLFFHAPTFDKRTSIWCETGCRKVVFSFVVHSVVR